MRVKNLIDMIFLTCVLCILTISFNSCKDSLLPEDWMSPPESSIQPFYVDVEITYQRIDDNPECPLMHPDNDDVVLRGTLPYEDYPGNLLDKIGEDLFHIKIYQVQSNFPIYLYTPDAYKVYVLDSAYGGEPSCTQRAHMLRINGELMKSIKSDEDTAEYALIRIDQLGNVHEVYK